MPRRPSLAHSLTPPSLPTATGHRREQGAPHQGVPGPPPEQDQPQEPPQIRRGFPQVSVWVAGRGLGDMGGSA